MARVAGLVLVLLLWGAAAQSADSYVPDSLKEWQPWVLDGKEYRNCPFWFSAGAKNRGETMEWRVALSAAQEKARIQVKGIGSLPAAFYAFWIERSRVIDLRKNAVVEVPPHEQELSGYCVVTANPDIVALYTDKLILKAAWPNPFGKSTNLTYVIPYDWLANGARVLDETRRVTIAIYDIRGRTIATLLDGAVAVGTHRTIWTGDDDNGNAVQSGVYIVRMTCNRLHATSRIFKIQ